MKRCVLNEVWWPRAGGGIPSFSKHKEGLSVIYLRGHEHPIAGWGILTNAYAKLLDLCAETDVAPGAMCCD